MAGPREYYHYSNLGFALLGEAVARLRGSGWWDCVVRELLEPLGMARTSYLPVAPHAQGYSVVHFTGELTREPHQDTGAMAPAGQAWSTVTDLLRWADFLAYGHPDVLAKRHPGGDGHPAATVRRLRARAPPVGGRRSQPAWTHGFDARVPGQPVRGPGDP